MVKKLLFVETVLMDICKESKKGMVIDNFLKELNYKISLNANCLLNFLLKVPIKRQLSLSFLKENLK